MKKLVMVLAIVFCGTVQGALAQDGLIVCETWNNRTIADPQELANDPKSLGAPTSTTLHANFDAPVNDAGMFVRRCRAQVKTPIAGAHTFWMASNGKGKLWQSTDQIYISKAPIATMTNAVAPAKNLYTRWPEQKSAVITVDSSLPQYLMLIYVDSVIELDTTTGAPKNVNHASVKWMLPDGSQQGPIAGVNLKVPPALTTVFTFTASPTTVTSGGTTNLNWSCNGTPTASATPVVANWTGVKPASGPQNGVSLTASTTFTLGCAGPGGTTIINVPVTVSVATPAPTCTFSASPTSIASGTASTATWNCSNAATTAVSNNTGLSAWSGSKTVTGSLPITFTSTTTLTLVATGPGGTSPTYTAVVTVVPPPTCTFTASPTSLSANAATTLSWNCSNSATRTASNNKGLSTWTGSKNAIGPASINVATTTIFTLVATNSVGVSVTKTVTVTVVPAPTCTFTASPTNVAANTATSLSWSCSNSTSRTASNNKGLSTWTGSKSANGPASITVATTTIFTLVATNSVGVSVTKTVTVTVTSPAPTCTFSASPTSVTSGDEADATWNCSNATSAVASNNTGLASWSGSKTVTGNLPITFTTTTTLTLVATGAGGTSPTYTATVTVTASTATVRLAWDESPEGDLAGYVLSYGASSGVYTESVTIAETAVTHAVAGLSDGTYYFALRAFNSAGLYSGYSNELRVILSGGMSTMSASTETMMAVDQFSTETSSARTSSVSMSETGEPFTDSGSSAPNEVLLVKDGQDLWIEDPLDAGWKLETGWSWNQSDPTDPAAVVKKDWILSTAANKILPGLLVSQDQVLNATAGNRYWTSLVYTPETGYAFGGIRKPNAAGFISGTKLVWFYSIHVEEGFAKFYPVAAVTMLEDNSGYVIYSRDDRGQWLTTTTLATGKFDLVLPDLSNWVKLQNVRTK